MTNEVYPNDPLALVVVEVRHALSPWTSPMVEELRTTLEDRVPLPRVEQSLTVEMTPQGAVPRQVRSVRLVSRNLRTSVTARDEALVVETTDYPGWESFSSLVNRAVAARADLSSPVSVDRIGIRFINEIRPPGELSTWSDWVSPMLLGPHSLAGKLGRSLRSSQGNIVLDAADQSSAQVINFGAAEGRAIEDQPNLHRLRGAAGPYFLIDIDSSWSAGGADDVPDFDPAMILSKLILLHEPIDAIFEALITEKLREEVLRVRPDRDRIG